MSKESTDLLSFSYQTPDIKRVYHLAYYQAPRYGFQDGISKYLQEFRAGREPLTSRWIALAVSGICKTISFDIIVRALHSKETTVGGKSPLDSLCQAIAKESGATYAPERLHKTRDTKPVGSLGAKAARQQELVDIYQFNDSGLSESCKILIVDDLVTTGSTLEAIAGAIRKTLPKAEINCFVLGRTQAFLQNTHLDPDYFASGNSPGSSRKGKRARTVSAAVTVSPQSPAGGAQVLLGKTLTALSRSVSKLHHKTRSRAASGISQRPLRRRIGFTVYLPVVAVAVVLLGGSLLMQPKGKLQPLENDLHQLMVDSHPVAPKPVAAPVSPVPPRPKVAAGKIGVITVPSMGLRSNHSLESKVVPNARISSREKVEILRKYSARSSPDWYEVKTRKGRVGWVLASMVREQKR